MADTRIEPSAALFVDDSSNAVAWAAEAGVRAVHMSARENQHQRQTASSATYSNSSTS